jgi:hypothetical protein
MAERLAKAGVAQQGGQDWHGVRLAEATPEELEHVLGDTILKEFKKRLQRVGVEYQTPLLPV